jgi:hypothetical protein
MRLVRGGNWFSDLFLENTNTNAIIEDAKNKYISSNPEPHYPDEYSELHDTLLREPTRFDMRYPWRTDSKDWEYTDRLQTWYQWAMNLKKATRDAAGLEYVY